MSASSPSPVEQAAGGARDLDAASGGLVRLRALLREQGGLLATLLIDEGDGGDGALDGASGGSGGRSVIGSGGGSVSGGGSGFAAPGGDRAGESGPAGGAGVAERPSPAEIAAEGPRAEGLREEYELLIEAIYEGYLLHYRAPRVVRVPEADLGLLAGDQLYAMGLARLVRLGDTHAVAELADTITLCALAHGAGDQQLADAVWAAGARAVGWGATDAHRQAKQLLRDGSPEAFEAMRTSAGGAPAAP